MVASFSTMLNKLILQLGGGVFVAVADDIIGCIKPEAVLPAFQIIKTDFTLLIYS